MRWERSLTVVGAHAEGEIGRVVTGGILDIRGSSMLEKLSFLNRERDDLRKFCLFEPRGCAQMTTNLLLPPVAPGADAAFIPMQADGSHAMSGSNAMCVVTVILETGILAMTEPETHVVLDTAAGIVRACATCRAGRVEKVALDFFPSFCEHLDHTLELQGYGTIEVDVAFGGVYYVILRAADLGIEIGPSTARELVEVGNLVKSAALQQISVRHPETPDFNCIEFVMFTGEVDRDRGIFQNATVMPPGRMDRSPCGTGTAARLAVMHARGEAQIGRRYEMVSTINSRFDAEILGVTRVGERAAVLPRISGRAWIYGIHQLGCDPSDPFRAGFTLADTWGTGMRHELPTLQIPKDE